MKHFLSLALSVALVAAAGASGAQVASGPSIALPPAQVILNACKEMGIEAVGGDYVLSRMPDLISGTGKVFVIDARPARNYDEGFIPTAFNMFDARFNRIYPTFQKLNLPKDTEILIGIGRPCPMSLSDIKQLREKGYMNLKAFVKGPVFFEKHFAEVTAKGAKKHMSNGAVLVDLADDGDLSRFFATNTGKGKTIILAGPAEKAKTNYALADRVYKAGYKNTAVFNGRIEDLK